MFSAKGDIEADLEASGSHTSYQSPHLSFCGGEDVGSRPGVRLLPRAGDIVRDWFCVQDR